MNHFTIDDVVKFSAGLTENEMEQLCDLAGIGLLNLNVSTGDIQLDRNLTILAGYEPGELPHSENTKIMLTFEDDRPKVSQAFGDIMSGKRDHYQLEYRMRRKDGSIVSVRECAIVSERDMDGNVKRIAGLGLDLSKLKWAEEKARLMEQENRRLAKGATQGELAEQNRMLRAANSAAAMIIGGFHQDYEVVLEQSLQILGESIQADRAYIWRNKEIDGKLYCYPRAQWARLTSSTFLDQDFLLAYDEFLPNWEELINQGYQFRTLVDQLSAAMQKFFDMQDVKSVMMIPLFLHGEFWGFVGFDECKNERIFTDDEAEIMSSGALVIASSVSRNETFKNLNEARKTAMDSTKAKGEFLSRMSHEIRTPMNAIIGMTTIAKRTDDIEKVRYCLDKVDVSSRQLLGIINDVLDMSKIDANKLEITNAPFDFEKMIQNIINMMQVRLEEKHLDFHLDINKVFTRNIICDELRLSQVLINLLSNAVKFTPESGSVTLMVREHEVEEGKSSLHIEVVDTGIGIDAQSQSKLFHSFEQADGSITRQFGGTGLGLAISKRIVNLMGGDIWVESEAGQGSKFIFEIEVEWGEDLPQKEFETTVPSSLRILVVDDNEDVLEYFTNILGSFSLECDTASSGKEAIAFVEKSIEKEQYYDILFIDWNMPVMSGKSTVEKIKELAGDKVIYVMISVAEWCDIEKEVKSCGVTNFLSKPVLPSVLYDSILELTRKNLVTMNAKDSELVPDWKNKHILLAEDVEINREIVANVLEDTNVQFTYAEDGEQAVRLFREMGEQFDLILMDVQMPNLDGLMATRQIRELEEETGEEIPIIAMTANAFKEDVEVCLEAGMNGHLAKPLNLNELYVVLRAYLDNE